MSDASAIRFLCEATVRWQDEPDAIPKLVAMQMRLHAEKAALEADLSAAEARADRLAVENAELRAALVIDGPHCDPEQGCEHPDDCPRGFVCMVCANGWDEGQAERHTPSCFLAAAPDTRGHAILEAAQRVADAWDAYPDGVDIGEVLDAAREVYVALRRPADGGGQE